MTLALINNSKVFLGYFTLHDFLFFSTRDYNKYTIIETIINNYALMYALNTKITEIHRLFSGTIPFYDQDYKKFQIYSTPAYFLEDFKNLITKNKNARSKPMIFRGRKAIVKDILNEWRTSTKRSFTYNAMGESYSFGVSKAELNFPNKGTNEKIIPLNSFIAFIIAPTIGPSIIRLGKKMMPCRVKYYELEDIKIKKGKFQPDHPINAEEMENKAEFIEGSATIMRPTPIIKNCILSGRYLEARLDNFKFEIFYPLLN